MDFDPLSSHVTLSHKFMGEKLGKRIHVQELGPLHTMVEGQKAVDFHPSGCKKPKIQPLDSPH